MTAGTNPGPNWLEAEELLRRLIATCPNMTDTQRMACLSVVSLGIGFVSEEELEEPVLDSAVSNTFFEGELASIRQAIDNEREADAAELVELLASFDTLFDGD